MIEPGQKFGHWIVLSRLPDGKSRQSRWLCKCICNKKKSVFGSCLRCGGSKSCGCKANHGNFTHGRCGTPEWIAWQHILQRCLNPNDAGFHHYGGRGIKVCKRWLRFENFFADMGKRPSPKHTIDRINNNGDYKLSNCRWATMKEQMNNTRGNRILTFNGKSQNTTQWANELGFISAHAITCRLTQLNWTVERALTTPVDASIQLGRDRKKRSLELLKKLV